MLTQYLESLHPAFPGGEDKLICFLDDHLDKQKLKSINRKGKIVVQFIIDTTGQVTNISVLTSLDPLVDNEFVRVIKLMPKWRPGVQNNMVVPVKIRLPLVLPYRIKSCG